MPAISVTTFDEPAPVVDVAAPPPAVIAAVLKVLAVVAVLAFTARKLLR